MNKKMVFYTISDIANILKISYDTALNLVKYSGIPHTRVGRQFRVEESDFVNYLNKIKQK